MDDKKKKPIVTKKRLKNALEKHDGIVVKAAEYLKVSRQYIYKMVKKHKMQDYLETLRNRQVDKALATIDDNMDDVDVALKYLAIKTRQESSRQKISVTDNNGNQINVTVTSDNKASKLNEFLKDDNNEDE